MVGVGKVSAAATTALLIEKFKVNEVIFTAVAGGGKESRIGDIVIGDAYLQHDVDLRPLRPQYYIYTLRKQVILADKKRVDRMYDAATRFLNTTPVPKMIGRDHSDIIKGPVVSGDQFIANQKQKNEILSQTREVLNTDAAAIEMEGAAVAQVCEEMNLPYIVVRTISDNANESTPVDFLKFMDNVASIYSLGVVKEYLHDSESISKE